MVGRIYRTPTGPRAGMRKTEIVGIATLGVRLPPEKGRTAAVRIVTVDRDQTVIGMI